MYASAVVEHLTTWPARDFATGPSSDGMAVLPHYSPGYPEWDVAEQPRLLELMKQTRSEQFPSRVDVFDSGMLRPKKTQLAVFGLTRHMRSPAAAHQPGSLRELLVRSVPVPARAVQTRAAANRRTGPARTPVLDLTRSTASIARRCNAGRKSGSAIAQSMPDGSLDAIFRYDGTTCTNMGRPLTFLYKVKLGHSAEGYPIREQRCAPAEGDKGHEFMCKFIEDSATLMAAIDSEKPLSGERLNRFLAGGAMPSAPAAIAKPQAASTSGDWCSKPSTTLWCKRN